MIKFNRWQRQLMIYSFLVFFFAMGTARLTTQIVQSVQNNVTGCPSYERVCDR